jgi:hypothetical protein
MNQGNFNHFDYDHYDQPPRSGGRSAFIENILGSSIMEKLRSPLFATAALLLTGAAFAGIIAISYPGDKPDAENVPVVLADNTSYKEIPDERGGMDVPFRDSTIFGSMNSDGKIVERPPVENLLEQEQPMAKLEAQADDGVVDLTAGAARTEPAAGDDTKTTVPSSALNPAAPAKEESTETSRDETAKPAEDVIASAEAPKPRVEVQEIISADEKTSPQELVAEAESASNAQKLHPPASSPETLAYVRSVLEKKDEKKDAVVTASPAPTPDIVASAPKAEEVAKVEPASGTPATAKITPGNYYVQLGSVKSESGAASEWSKLQKSFGTLAGLDYRVQRAEVADKGTFFRIQAGPMSKDSANSVCGAIKSQKPGGCIIVQ